MKNKTSSVPQPLRFTLDYGSKPEPVKTLINPKNEVFIKDPGEEYENFFNGHLNYRNDSKNHNESFEGGQAKMRYLDPYDFDQHSHMAKIAANEFRTLGYGPEYHARNLLTVWAGADGPLQNFYNAYTLRMSNADKQAVAEFVKEMSGFEVVPTLLDETPRYADNTKGVKNLKKTAKSVLASFLKKAETYDAQKLIQYFSQVFPEDYTLALVGDSLNQATTEEGITVTAADAQGLLDYYTRAYGDQGYASQLVNGVMSGVPSESLANSFADEVTPEHAQMMEKALNQGARDPQFGPGTTPSAAAGPMDNPAAVNNTFTVDRKPDAMTVAKRQTKKK